MSSVLHTIKKIYFLAHLLSNNDQQPKQHSKSVSFYKKGPPAQPFFVTQSQRHEHLGSPRPLKSILPGSLYELCRGTFLQELHRVPTFLCYAGSKAQVYCVLRLGATLSDALETSSLLLQIFLSKNYIEYQPFSTKQGQRHGFIE